MASRKNITFKITVTGWDKHNYRVKKGFEYFMLSNRFFDDHKIATLTTLQRLLFITILSRCADSRSSTCSVTAHQLSTMCSVSRHCFSTSLNVLQELQLLTYEKIEPLHEVKLSELKLSEVKLSEGGKEKKSEVVKVVKSVKEVAPRNPKDSAPDEKTNVVIARYCEKWKLRYGGNAPIGGKVSGMFKGLVKDFGTAKAIDYIEAYLDMRDSWFITKRHDIPTLLANLNSVAQFLETGRTITKKEIRNMDDALSTQNMLDMVDRGEL